MDLAQRVEGHRSGIEHQKLSVTHAQRDAKKLKLNDNDVEAKDKEEE